MITLLATATFDGKPRRVPLAAAAHRVVWQDLQNGLAWATWAEWRARVGDRAGRAESVLRGRELLSAGSSAMMYHHCRAIYVRGA